MIETRIILCVGIILFVSLAINNQAFAVNVCTDGGGLSGCGTSTTTFTSTDVVTPVETTTISVSISSLDALTITEPTSSIFTSIPVVSGGGSGSGSQTAPSFTTGFSEDELPFLLNGNEIDVSNFVNEVGVTTIKTGEATNLSLLLSDDDGVIYVGLYTNLRDSERQRHQSDTIIEWRNNDGLSVIDPHGYFEDASVIVSDKGNKKEFSFDITFANAMEKSDLIVYVWDIRRNAFQTTILDMWEVIDSPKPSHVTEPEITTDVSEPSKDTSESIPPTNISVVMDNWAGYSESTSSDSEMLQSIGLEGEYIPSWVKKLGEWVHKGLIDDADFINAIKNLHSRGLVY